MLLEFDRGCTATFSAEAGDSDGALMFGLVTAAAVNKDCETESWCVDGYYIEIISSL